MSSYGVAAAAPPGAFRTSTPAAAASRPRAAGASGRAEGAVLEASLTQQLIPSKTTVLVDQSHTSSSCDEECPEGRQCYFYDWKWESKICYIRSGSSGPVLLLCHGFGVGVHHFEDNIPALAGSFQPTCADSGPLRYNVDTWTEQLQHFIKAVIKQPVYIAGNSLGGLLGVSLAFHHPEHVKGLVLLNAAPAWNFWCSGPPLGSEGRLHNFVRNLLQIDGSVPAPKPVKATVGKLWFDVYRKPATVRSLLQLVYGRTCAIDDELVERIIEATEHPEAADAFTSIVLSPESALTFEEMIQDLSCPVCLAYGASDPWIVPLWGQRVKRWLPQAHYLELDCVGHCPHHEAPSTVNQIIATWVQAVENGQQQQQQLLQEGSRLSFQEADGSYVQVTCHTGHPRNALESLDHTVWSFRRAVGHVLQHLASPGEFF
eukprot:gene5191-5429_t